MLESYDWHKNISGILTQTVFSVPVTIYGAVSAIKNQCTTALYAAKETASNIIIPDPRQLARQAVFGVTTAYLACYLPITKVTKSISDTKLILQSFGAGVVEGASHHTQMESQSHITINPATLLQIWRDTYSAISDKIDVRDSKLESGKTDMASLIKKGKIEPDKILQRFVKSRVQQESGALLYSAVKVGSFAEKVSKTMTVLSVKGAYNMGEAIGYYAMKCYDLMPESDYIPSDLLSSSHHNDILMPAAYFAAKISPMTILKASTTISTMTADFLMNAVMIGLIGCTDGMSSNKQDQKLSELDEKQEVELINRIIENGTDLATKILNEVQDSYKQQRDFVKLMDGILLSQGVTALQEQMPALRKSTVQLESRKLILEKYGLNDEKHVKNTAIQYFDAAQIAANAAQYGLLSSIYQAGRSIGKSMSTSQAQDTYVK